MAEIKAFLTFLHDNLTSLKIYYLVVTKGHTYLNKTAAFRKRAYKKTFTLIFWLLTLYLLTLAAIVIIIKKTLFFAKRLIKITAS